MKGRLQPTSSQPLRASKKEDKASTDSIGRAWTKGSNFKVQRSDIVDAKGSVASSMMSPFTPSGS